MTLVPFWFHRPLQALPSLQSLFEISSQDLISLKIIIVFILEIKIPLYISKYFHLIGTRYDHSGDKEGTYLKDMYIPFVTALASSTINFSIDILHINCHDQYFFLNLSRVLETATHSFFLQSRILLMKKKFVLRN